MKENYTEQVQAKNRAVDFVQEHRVLAPALFWGAVVLICVLGAAVHGGFSQNTESAMVYADTASSRAQGRNSYTEASAAGCLMHRLTLRELQSMAAEEGIQVAQSDLDAVNQTPLCRDVCIEQLAYSKKYSEWYARDDMRETCTSLGVTLPANR